MGVSGVGKTTIGKHLAAQLQLSFYDADDFHPKANIDKMSNGIPLQDKDRWPWLDHIAAQMPIWVGQGAILACSALKEVYRKRLVPSEFQKNVQWIYLEGTYNTIKERLVKRKGHFFNPELLKSQFETLEPPLYGLKIDISNTIDKIIQKITNQSFMKNDLGLLGLGVMGKALARNFAGHGIKLSLYNRRVEGLEEGIAEQFIAEYPALNNAKGYEDIIPFVASLSQPRAIFLMISAGNVIDTVINQLIPHLSAGDILIDGGNSHFKDTERRIQTLAKKQIRFLGVGVSGGEEGALRGPSIMPGGNEDAYKKIAPLLKRIAARDSTSSACCAFVGKGGSGHFIKTIHNGIEYAEMQLITEVYNLLRFELHYDLPQLVDILSEWNEGHLKSYLLEVTIAIFKQKDGDQYVLDVILDKAKQKGTGGWSTTSAMKLGQPFDTIAAAVMARNISSQKTTRIAASKIYKLNKTEGASPSVDSIKQAYTIARILNHGIGFETMKAASDEYHWDLKLSEIARIWTNGCIIRSQLMEELIEYLKEDRHLLFEPKIVEMVSESYKALTEVVTYGLLARQSLPVFSAALNYINALTTASSTANLIQAQRDFFGAHTYERIDKEGTFHTIWGA